MHCLQLETSFCFKKGWTFLESEIKFVIIDTGFLLHIIKGDFMQQYTVFLRKFPTNMHLKLPFAQKPFIAFIQSLECIPCIPGALKRTLLRDTTFTNNCTLKITSVAVDKNAD